MKATDGDWVLHMVTSALAPILVPLGAALAAANAPPTGAASEQADALSEPSVAPPSTEPDSAPAPSAPTPPAQTDFGTLRLETEPSGAECWLDSVRVGSSPCVLTVLDPDVYFVELLLDGYYDARFRQRVEAGQTTEVRIALEPVRPVPVVIASDPPGTDMYIDGRPVRRDASGRFELLPGPHLVYFEHDDYAGARRVIDVRAEGDNRLDVKMTPGLSESQKASRHQRLLWGGIFCALAAGAAAIATWQGLEAESAVARMQSQSPGDPAVAEAQASGRTSAAVADGAGTVAALSAALGGGLLLSLTF